jgi:hypothetical protein
MQRLSGTQVIDNATSPLNLMTSPFLTIGSGRESTARVR